ncbi:hypothetical protein [Methylorubrum extorquens]
MDSDLRSDAPRSGSPTMLPLAREMLLQTKGTKALACRSSKHDTGKAHSMNAEAIKSRDEALALLDANLITIHDFMTLCDLKGWDR